MVDSNTGGTEEIHDWVKAAEEDRKGLEWVFGPLEDDEVTAIDQPNEVLEGMHYIQPLSVALLGRFAYAAHKNFPSVELPQYNEVFDAAVLKQDFPKMRDLPVNPSAMCRAFGYYSADEDGLPGWSTNSIVDTVVFLIRLLYRASSWVTIERMLAEASTNTKSGIHQVQGECAKDGQALDEGVEEDASYPRQNVGSAVGKKKKRKKGKGKGKAGDEDEVNTAALAPEDPIGRHDYLLRMESLAELEGRLETIWDWHLSFSEWHKYWVKLAYGSAPHWCLYTGRLRHSWLPATEHSPGRVWFLFDQSYQPHASGARPVVLHDPMMVIEVLRNESLTSRAELIKYCVQQGIEHASPCRRIAKPSDDQLRELEQAKAIRAAEQNYGVRLKHIDFVPEDFIQYLDTLVDWMRRNPRIALLAARRGGLYWRLVLQCGVMPDINAFDEMSDLAAWGFGHTYTCGDFEFGCDGFTMEEEAKFIGTFDRTTGKSGDNIAKVSFFPRHEVWARCSMNTGSWTSSAEDWFERRYHSMHDDITISQPQTSPGWRHNLRSADVSRLVVHQGRRRAEAFLESRYQREGEEMWQYVIPNLRGGESFASC
jgi:hypothetical protein